MSVMKEIEEKEAKLKLQLHQLELLEEKVRRELIFEERDTFEKEINALKDSLYQTEKELKRLRRENRKSFFLALSVFTMIVIIMIYFFNL